MKKQGLFTLLLLLFIYLIPACEESVPDLQLKSIDLVDGIQVLDFGNEGNAEDFILFFSIQNPSEADQIQIFLRKGPDLSLLDREDVENPGPDRLFTLELSNNNYQIQLPASQLDLEGNPLEKDVEYSIGFLVQKGEEVFLNEDFGIASLKEEHFLNGEYVGTWDDNLYTAFGISARLSLRLAGGRASGAFFYSKNFTSCCQGENDGNISFNLKEDGSIEDFIYRQDLVQFQGGACPGTYTGQGRLDNFTTLLIDFSGDDCEGPHTGGKIRLVKQVG